jgi:hypothetical protein
LPQLGAVFDSGEWSQSRGFADVKELIGKQLPRTGGVRDGRDGESWGGLLIDKIGEANTNTILDMEVQRWLNIRIGLQSATTTRYGFYWPSW